MVFGDEVEEEGDEDEEEGEEGDESSEYEDSDEEEEEEGSEEEEEEDDSMVVGAARWKKNIAGKAQNSFIQRQLNAKNLHTVQNEFYISPNI